MAGDSPVRVLIVVSHPVQYNAPVYRHYALDPRIDVTVAFCSMQGVKRGHDPGFGVDVAWDIPLLDGYSWTHVRNASPLGLGKFFGLVNPGLWPLIRRGSFDVVVCCGYASVSFWIAALAAKASQTTLAWANDAPTIDRPGLGTLRRLVKRPMLRLIYRIGDAAIAPSTPAAELSRELGMPRDRIFLTPYAMDVGRFGAGTAGSWRTNLGIPKGRLIALFVGKLIARKRPSDAILACSRVSGCHLILAGEGEQRRRLELLAADVAPTRVHFVGLVNQSELPNLYAAADALVVCSDYDPFPIVVMEAMSSGRPVVASSSIGSIGDLVRHGETGLVYPCGDVDELADRLSWLREHGEGMREMGFQALSRMAQWGPSQNREAFVAACLALAGPGKLS